MNGFHVGRWERANGGSDRLVYHRDWIESPQGRPLSLSLPFTRGHGVEQGSTVRGEVVTTYFENLIPDNARILQRLRSRYNAASIQAFDLLAAIGRDCAGAVQLTPVGESPTDAQRIHAEPLDESGVAQLLRDTTSGGPLSDAEADAYRLSIAGAQEKTALLKHNGRWCIPHGATPTTHIFKLPLGLVGNMRADLSQSVPLEWLSMEIARELGLPVANVDIGQFEDQTALIVERFDRQLSADKTWWQRIPQEDFCQALGLSPSRKYEADGGPGMRSIIDVLLGSENDEADRRVFFTTQIVFWLMAATDGHAKNFSLHLRAGGAYHLTPLYDILSTYPIQGNGPNKLDAHKAKLAMAMDGKNRHYLIRDIHRWHWIALSEKLGLRDGAQLIESLTAQIPHALHRIASRLPQNFPDNVFDAVNRGMRDAARHMASEPDQRP
jgi:serine/threonine-protein kinase HipA